MKHSRKSHVSFSLPEEEFLNELSKFSAKVFVNNDLIKEWIVEYRETKDEVVLNKILAQVTRFVMFIAKKYKTPHIDIRDPIIEAMYGIIEAVDKYYRLDSNQKFITYIKVIVERRIKDTCDGYKQAVRLPKNVLSSQGKLKKHNNTKETIYSKVNFYNSHGMQSYISGVIYADESLNRESLIFDINRVLSYLLTSEERYIIISTFGLNNAVIRSLETISTDLNISVQNVRDLKSLALKKLRSDNEGLLLLSKYLEDFN